MTKQELIEEINAVSISDNYRLRFCVLVWNEWGLDKTYECHDIDTVAGLLFELSLSHGVSSVGCCGIKPIDMYCVTLNLQNLHPDMDTNLDSESIDAVLDFLKRQWGG